MGRDPSDKSPIRESYTATGRRLIRDVYAYYIAKLLVVGIGTGRRMPVCSQAAASNLWPAPLSVLEPQSIIAIVHGMYFTISYFSLDNVMTRSNGGSH